MPLAEDFPQPMTPAQSAEFRRRRRGRNIALMLVLVGVALLFYAVAVVKLSGS